MELLSPAACTAYVEGELSRLSDRRPDWHWGRRPDVPLRPLSWTVGRQHGEYSLRDVCMEHHEFLVWFGHHQVGAEGVPWITRPAVHVAFEDLWPRKDPVALRFGLADVLAYMIATLDRPAQFVMRFAVNDESLT